MRCPTLSERIRVAETADLQPGDVELIEVNSVSIAVFNVEGEYFAIQNTCLHQNGSICEGSVEKALEGTWEGPGKRVREEFSGEPAVACPWHGWEYDLGSGVHLGDGEYKLATYDTVVEDGVVFVHI